MSAEILRVAGGQVRCGQCGETFNALSRLAEEPAAFVKSEAESPLEMEARADRILESSSPSRTGSAPATADAPPPARPGSPAPPARPAASPAAPTTPSAAAARSTPTPTPAAPTSPSAPSLPPALPDGATDEEEIELFEDGEEIAHLQVIDVPGETLEFSLPPTELDRVFVEPKARRPTTPLASPPAPASSPAQPGAPLSAEAPAARPSSAPPSAAGTPKVPAHGRVPRAPAGREPPVETAIDLDGPTTLPPHPESREAEAARLGAMKAASAGEVSDEVRRAMLAGLSDQPLPLLERSGRGVVFYAWLAAALVLAALLALQILSSGGGWVARTLGVGGAALPSLAAYQQQVWGVTGEPGANGTLRVRASILNGSAQLEPYPLLRITLTDRFGNRIGTRDFEPAEYLGRPTVKMLAPGERVDATLEIQDPGRDAEGYELDVCLRAGQPQVRVVCAGDSAAPSAR